MPEYIQRQTVISQFFQLDRLVVEGQKTVSLVLYALSKSPYFQRPPLNECT